MITMKPNIQTMNEDDYWDCPYCEQPMQPENDKECHCGMRVSHHLSVSTLCKQLRQAQQRESALIVENNEQARLLGMSAERECDLRGKMERLERERDELREESIKWRQMAIDSDKRFVKVVQIRDYERALADQFADALLSTFSSWVMSPKSEQLAKCLATWKEARNES